MILTFKQYVRDVRADARSSYGISAKTARECYPEHALHARWWSYVLDAFEAGEDFSVQGLRTLNKAQFRDLSRTTRGLRQGLPLPYLLASARLFS